MTRPKISDMWRNAVDEKPRHFTFESDGYTVSWDTVYPDVSDWDARHCLLWLADYTGEKNYRTRADDWQGEVNRFSAHEGVAADEWEETATDELRDAVRDKMPESERYSPMMNTLYPLPDLRHSPNDAQELVEGTSCVVVMIRDDDDSEPSTPYLALAGGGMDLSWDICEAYMLLGYLPPLHFCDLPEYAGKKLDTKARWILAGCKESCRTIIHRAQRQLERLRNVRKALAGDK